MGLQYELKQPCSNKLQQNNDNSKQSIKNY